LIQIKARRVFVRHIANMKTVPSARSCAVLSICSPKIVLLLAMALLGAACGDRRSEPVEKSSQYQARGVVRWLPPGHKAIEVEHEEIPGFMPSMTMPFEVHEEQEIAKLVIGDAISFQLNVTQRDSWIDQVRKIDPSQLHLPSATPPPSQLPDSSPRLREGDRMPEFQLVNQDGQTITQETFRGHLLVLTFVFTRCPIPNFCPLMSQNFVALQEGINTASGSAQATQLLTISFDPFDTPEILKAYAASEHADPLVWSFATAAKVEIEKLTQSFSVFVKPEGGTISHGLATALIDREGKILKIWRGNSWSPSEILRELREGSE
jgi:protein SCO1/2